MIIIILDEEKISKKETIGRFDRNFLKLLDEKPLIWTRRIAENQFEMILWALHTRLFAWLFTTRNSSPEFNRTCFVVLLIVLLPKTCLNRLKMSLCDRNYTLGRQRELSILRELWL